MIKNPFDKSNEGSPRVTEFRTVTTRKPKQLDDCGPCNLLVWKLFGGHGFFSIYYNIITTFEAFISVPPNLFPIESFIMLFRVRLKSLWTGAVCVLHTQLFPVTIIYDTPIELISCTGSK